MNLFPRLVWILGALVAMLAQVAWSTPADEKLLADYRLNDAKVKTWAQATRNLVQAFKEHPELMRSQDKVDADKASIAEIAAWYDSKPPLKDAINSAGMSSQEYTTFLFSMFQAGMGAWLAEQQGLEKLPKGMPRENVEYYLENKERLTALGEELEKLAPKQ
jgi:hypothetical protein